jgi:hypothetical protein
MPREVVNAKNSSKLARTRSSNVLANSAKHSLEPASMMTFAPTISATTRSISMTRGSWLR